MTVKTFMEKPTNFVDIHANLKLSPNISIALTIRSVDRSTQPTNLPLPLLSKEGNEVSLPNWLKLFLANPPLAKGARDRGEVNTLSDDLP